MSKLLGDGHSVNGRPLFAAVLAFTTASLAVGHQGFGLDLFLNNPKIKLLSNPGVKGAYPDGDTNYDDLLKALASLSKPITIEKVEQVLKEHAPKLYTRIEAAEKAFSEVIESVRIGDVKYLLVQYLGVLQKYYLVGLPIDEQAQEAERILKLANALSDEDRKAVGEKLKEALDGVLKALYSPSV